MQTFVDVFRAVSQADPGRAALLCEGKSLSYAELDGLTGRLARALYARGAKRGAIVPILLPRGIDAAVALLAVLRAGAAAAVVSADYPAARVRFIQEDTGAAWMLDEALFAELAAQDEASLPPLPDDAAPSAADRALVVYTSGSTGNPKGVLLSHRALSLAVAGNALSRTRDDVFLSTASFSFVAVALDLLAPLALGATVHIAPDAVRKDAAALVAYVREHGVTTAFFPPQMAAQVLPQVEDVLRVMVTGSEKVRGLYSEKAAIFNLYGASETCGPMCSFRLDRLYEDSAPIGFPYAGSSMLLLGEDGAPVAAGEEGEICVAGQVSDGYLNLPEMTAAHFVPNPAATGEDDKILYKTGDIGRLREDGAMVYVQRKDWMVKVRGFRVEPGEVEAAILRLAPVKQAVVTSFQNPAGETALYAAYTAEADVPPETVRAAVTGFLPDYMVPAFLEQLPALPLNQNGKVDRKNIAPPDAARFQTAYEPPASDAERAVCAAFAAVLGVEKAGALDDFTLLGGDSISAARLQAALPDIGLTAADILALRTPRALAAKGAERAAAPAFAPDAARAGRTEWPLTFTEQQMATEQGLDPASIAYNINLAFRIDGALDVPKLERALSALVARHAILRSYYPLQSGVFSHRVAPPQPVVLGRQACAPGEVPGLIRAGDQPYDITRAPLYRFNLFSTGGGQAVLHMAFHHIIVDGSSMPAMLEDLWALYRGVALPPAAPDYLDWAVWQAEHGNTAGGEAFFKAMFPDGAPENEMPTRPLRPDVLPFADTDCEAALPAAALDAAAKRLGVTTYGLLAAATALTLAKYCGSEDVVFGAAMAGRRLPELSGMAGMFVNTVPVRVKTPGTMQADDFVRGVAKLIREVKEHEDYPFEELVPQLAPERNPSRAPVFDLILNYLHALPLPAVAGLSMKEIPLKRQALAIDLMLEALREGEHLRLVLSYSPALYDGQIVTGMMEQLCAILRRLAGNNSGLPLADLAELPENQRRQILEDFAGEHSDENLGKTVVELFRQRTKEQPDAKAVVSGSTVLTYAQLNDVTDRLAAHLAAKGAGTGKVVGILAGRSEHMPVCAMGALKTGAAYLPLDPSYPADRLEFMLEDAGANLLLADEGLEAAVPGFGGEIIHTSTIETLPAVTPPAGPKPEDLLILLYTSGTTGKPKGVMLSHANLTNFCTWYCRFHGIGPGDNIPAYASFGFDANMMDTYPALISGACMHIIPEEMRLDLPGMRDYFEQNNATVAFITTQLGRQFAESMENHTLRALSVGGEALVPVAPPEGYALYNVYGPTECTVLVTYFRVNALCDRVPIGRALANTALYVVDKNNRLSPVGAAGELCIAGRQVAMGYLGRPDVTAEKFTPNPFSDDPGYARVYRTGDVVRFLPDGNIDFVGRRDFQVKIRGFRVELTEIESRIRAFSEVTDAAVVALDAPGGGKCAVAYIVSPAPVDVEQLNAFIEEVLPPYMVPAATMQLDAIPLNPNGKVDRRKLPPPEYAAADAEDSGARPQNALETGIAGVVAAVVGHENFSLSTDLLRAGLTSLSAIRLAAGLDDKFGLSVPVREIMAEPTVLGIENALIAKLLARAAEGDAAAPAGARAQSAHAPLSQSQMGVYLDCLKDPDALQYNVPFIFSADADADGERLRTAVRDVLAAHPVVCMHLATVDGRVVQMAGDTEPSVSYAEMDEAAFDAFTREFARPFDLMKGPLYRAAVVKTPRRVALVADIHHIVFDGGSLDLLLRQVCEAYGGKAPAAERLTCFAAAEVEAAAEGGEAYLADKAYFDEKLSAFEGVSEIAPDLPRADEPGNLREVVRLANRADVEAFCAAHGVTPAGVFLAATAYAVSRWVYANDVYLSGISSGRGDVRLQNSFGMFVRTLPLVVKRAPGQTALDYIRAAGEALSGAVAHEGYPYTKLAEQYGYSPSIMYTNELGVTGEYAVGGKAAHFEGLALERPKFKLSVHIEERGGDMVFAVQYDDALYTAPLMEAFAGTLAIALQNLLAAPGTPVAGVSLMGEAQCAAVAAFNKTDAPQPFLVLHRMFEHTARAYPDRLALIAADGAFTYAQLDAEANKVANGLLARGLQKEDRVALLLHRTSRVLISMLGVLKAGGAYIPLDPDYPADRIAHVLSDSGAKIMLTTSGLAGDFPAAADVDALRESQPATPPDVDVEGGNLAYIIYTSGSTGKPKGVMIEHRGIANYVAPLPENRHVHALVENATRFMSITTVAFDMFLKESMASLCNGLCLIFADESTAHDPVRLAAYFAETGADAFNTTPSLMMEYTEYPALLAAIRACKIIMCGAEKYPPALLARLVGGEGARARLFNTYGPTEITVSSNAKELKAGKPVNIGGPLLGVHEQVVDTDGNPLPPFVLGELYIGGRGVARGYVNLPEQTAERFVQYCGGRVYKSGDLARWTPSGEVEILGRNDGQIKLRGLRIELGEVESAIMAVPGVRTCAAAVRRIQNGEHLCAWYVADAALDPAAIREQISKTLTPYMVPTAYLQIDAMPKTPGGKNDLRALPPPQLLRSQEYEAPHGALEESICAVFAQVLGLPQVGALDNFFEIGGSSLAVTRVIIAAEEANLRGDDGGSISYGDVFANPTPRALASLLRAGGETPAPPAMQDDYDYAPIDALLAENSTGAFLAGAPRPVGDALLTGATGFLGIHMLSALLTSGTGRVVCLVRPGKRSSAEARLKNLLYYYFEDSMDDAFATGRLVVLDGDITDANNLATAASHHIDTVFNCAANVSHFAKDDSTFDVNIGGVQNLIDFCAKTGARFIQVSTASVAGFSVDGTPPRGTVMTEQMLYFGQNMENQYVHSKFLAERAVLAAAQDGLDAKIMRVGNLMARNRDGEFQVNARSNSFVGRLRAYHAVGCFPYSAYGGKTELAPIDSTTSAILRLSTSPAACRVFHPYNNHFLFMGDIIAAMREEGIAIEMVEDDVFERALSSAMKDPARAERLMALVAYQNVAKGRAAVPLASSNDYTTGCLLRTGWRWPQTSEGYLQKFLQGLIGLGLFDA